MFIVNLVPSKGLLNGQPQTETRTGRLKKGIPIEENLPVVYRASKAFQLFAIINLVPSGKKRTHAWKGIQSTHICLFDIYKVDPKKWGVVFVTWKSTLLRFLCGVELEAIMKWPSELELDHSSHIILSELHHDFE